MKTIITYNVTYQIYERVKILLDGFDLTSRAFVSLLGKKLRVQ
jgi:hypothetical protein